MAVSAIKWETASAESSLMTTVLNSLANNNISAAGTEYVNAANLNTRGWLKLNVTFGSAPSDNNPTVDVWIAQDASNAEYDSAPVSGGTDQGHMLLLRIPVRKVTTAQIITVPIPGYLPPHDFKLYLDNQTGVAFPASGSTLKMYVNNFEGQ